MNSEEVKRRLEDKGIKIFSGRDFNPVIALYQTPRYSYIGYYWNDESWIIGRFDKEDPVNKQVEGSDGENFIIAMESFKRGFHDFFEQLNPVPISMELESVYSEENIIQRLGVDDEL